MKCNNDRNNNFMRTIMYGVLIILRYKRLIVFGWVVNFLPILIKLEKNFYDEICCGGFDFFVGRGAGLKT